MASEVVVSHVWETGASTQVIIKAKVYPEALETTEDIPDHALSTFVAAITELIQVAETEVEVEAGEP